ncbi:MAG: ArgE/DapE family deacylase [Gaiellales bacterium]
MPTRSPNLPLVSDDDLARAVDAQAEWIEDLAMRLIAIPSTLGNEEPAQAVMADAFRELELEPVDVPFDAEALRDSPLAAPFGWDVTGKRNVVATWAATGTGGRSLALNGHVDVVPPAAPELWTHDPFTPVRDGDWLVGRGAGDMKAGIAATLGAVRALRSLAVELRGDLQLQSVLEEECGGNGALQCVLSLPRVDACVIAEPFPGAISISQVGVLWFTVELLGVPAHVGDAEHGVNAIEAAFPVIARLRELEAELNEDPPPPYDSFPHPINLNIGTLVGGDWISTVPAACILGCRLAVFPGQPVAELKRRIEAAVAEAAAAHPWLAKHPPRVGYEGFAGNGVEVPADSPIVTALAGAHLAATGDQATLVPTTATTDARAFVESGVPAVCFGPHAESLHGVDERVFVPSVIATARVLATLVRDWCGVTR